MHTSGSKDVQLPRIAFKQGAQMMQAWMKPCYAAPVLPSKQGAQMVQLMQTPARFAQHTPTGPRAPCLSGHTLDEHNPIGCPKLLRMQQGPTG